jgi:transposase
MRIRRQVSTATGKALHTKLPQAYAHDEVRLRRRTTVLLDLLGHHVPVEALCEPWGLRPACIYGWRQAFLRRGMASLVSRHGGGRRPKLTAKQKKRLVELREAGPLVVGCETAWWTSVLLRVLLWRECGVLSNCPYIGTLLHNRGFSFHKARLVSEHLETAKRLAWLAEAWPAIVRAAKRCHGLILCEDEASCAQWGSVSSTWARRGHQPEVKPSGTRKGYKVFGAMEYFSGRLVYQGMEGRLTSDSSQQLLRMLLAHTTAHLFLIHDGARDHTSQATQQCLETHCARITAYPLPSSAPDYHPIAYLWKKTKKRATHHQDCKECAALTVSVDRALAYCATHPAMVLGLLGLYCKESGLELKQAA